MIALHLILQTLARETAPAWSTDEVVTGVIRLSIGVAIALVVYRFVVRNPWPRPFRLRFAALHIAAAAAFALAWHETSSVIQALVSGRPILAEMATRLDEGMFIGVLMYIIVAGISYAFEGAARAARAETIAARTQLAALRAQLHPHFLFNALHTVVQLIPVEQIGRAHV